jgi:hypothetical protein
MHVGTLPAKKRRRFDNMVVIPEDVQLGLAVEVGDTGLAYPGNHPVNWSVVDGIDAITLALEGWIHMGGSGSQI